MIDLPTLTKIPTIKLSYNTQELVVEKCIISCSQDAYEALTEIYDNDTIELYEEAKVLYLNNAGQIL